MPAISGLNIPSTAVNVVVRGTGNQVSIVSFPADASVHALIDSLVPSDSLSFSPQAIPSDQYFVASAQPQQNQIQFGLSPSAQPASQADLAALRAPRPAPDSRRSRLPKG